MSFVSIFYYFFQIQILNQLHKTTTVFTQTFIDVHCKRDITFVPRTKNVCAQLKRTSTNIMTIILLNFSQPPRIHLTLSYNIEISYSPQLNLVNLSFWFFTKRQEVDLACNIRSFHSDAEYRPIDFPVSHLLQNLDQSVAFCATTPFTIGWRPVHNFLLMKLV